ncbi:MAG: putative peptide modification system cyclase [Xanthomonadales bacterium]|nr:putative peptide modification system cyclase [Xanthomonadales bacterium]
MNAQLAPEDLGTEPAPDGARALLRSVVIADLCDSTALVERLGDVRATELIRAHDRLLRGLIREHRGQEIDKTDGFLSLFERPIQAVAFALAYQRGLRAFSLEHGIEVSARIGVHVGEVMTWQNDLADVAKGAKPTEVEGLAKPVAARLMGMALPGQILLSGVAYTLAHRAEGELGAVLSRVQWKAHGDFRFKGVAEAVPVYEIGEDGIAPFKAPAWSGKAHREVPLWRRPAMLAFEMIALLLAVALPAWHFLTPAPAIAFAERDWVVLADLRNLTGDPRFDDSLDQAFRIGLEQSRHVNVLSDLQVRDTLQRMQRDSDSPVDRSIGAEIAMREGARALVLPTLAEVGGRLRFTAEVIHPNTQATVYSEYADGRGAEAVLPLVDEVNRKLRGRLGEAVDQVSEDSRALERVTTPNLDALTAYTRARALLLERKLDDAISLLNVSLSIDTEFAAASLELAVIMNDAINREAALTHLERALANPDRLTLRQLRHASAIRATLIDSPASAVEAWRMLTVEFPDYHVGWGGLAWYQWVLLGDSSAAINSVQKNIDSRNPRRSGGHYLYGTLLLAENRFQEAIQQFEAAEALGLKVENRAFAAAYAAQRDFKGASQVLERGTASSLTLRSGAYALAIASHLADRGRIGEARAVLQKARRELPEGLGADRRTLAVAQASLLDVEVQSPSEDLIEEASELIAQAAVPSDDRLLTPWMRTSATLLSLWATAHLSDSSRFEDTSSVDVTDDFPELKQRTMLAHARAQRLSGHPELAAASLSRPSSTKPLFATRVELMRALIEAGALDKAEGEAKWIAANRGLAYAEPQAFQALVPYNVFWSTQALFVLAEIEALRSNWSGASVRLEEFLNSVDEAHIAPKLRRRVGELRSEIAENAAREHESADSTPSAH